ncbi:MAG: glycosyl hydrolase family 18 protein [Gemmatimonadota bacterium]|nr:glycosyl hydrolase family 18 protein [Gemmatimonadota bacterium]
MRRRFGFAFLAVAAPAAAFAQARPLEALWYARGAASTESFAAHADRVTIVSPQSFTLDSTGMIHGSLDPRLVEVARARGVKLVPLVMNPGFDQPSIHRVLTNPAARAAAIASLGRMCSAHRLDGIQFDIENVHVSDKAAFTSFARDAAAVVHRAGCTLSAAVVPRTGEERGPTSYHQWIRDNWRGAYDYKALAESLDFLSYMTYAQHTGNSTPGPVAGYPWTEECLRYVLSLGVPPSKISLGLAAYSDWWYPSYDDRSGPRPRGSDVSYARAMEVAANSGVTPAWDPVQKALFAQWEVAGVFEQVWVEDARAFEAKLALVRKYGLRGYSVWKLGDEDPKTWDIVK